MKMYFRREQDFKFILGLYTAQKMKFSMKDFFHEQILNEKLHFMGSVTCIGHSFFSMEIKLPMKVKRKNIL